MVIRSVIPSMSDLSIHEKTTSSTPRTTHLMNKYSGVLLGNIWGLKATDSERIYCFIGWQCFSVPEMYGKKIIMETYVRQDAEPFFDIDRYLWPSDSKRSWNVHETSDLYKPVLDWIINVMDCFSFEKPVIIDGSNLRVEPELRRGAIRIENCSRYGKADANYGLDCRKYNCRSSRLSLNLSWLAPTHSVAFLPIFSSW